MHNTLRNCKKKRKKILGVRDKERAKLPGVTDKRRGRIPGVGYKVEVESQVSVTKEEAQEETQESWTKEEG